MVGQFIPIYNKINSGISWHIVRENSTIGGSVLISYIRYILDIISPVLIFPIDELYNARCNKT